MTAKPLVRYSYIDGVLMSEKSGERQILYLYDENGIIMGVKVIEGDVSKTYYYQLNLQGDETV